MGMMDRDYWKERQNLAKQQQLAGKLRTMQAQIDRQTRGELPRWVKPVAIWGCIGTALFLAVQMLR